MSVGHVVNTIQFALQSVYVESNREWWRSPTFRTLHWSFTSVGIENNKAMYAVKVATNHFNSLLYKFYSEPVRIETVHFLLLSILSSDWSAFIKTNLIYEKWTLISLIRWSIRHYLRFQFFSLDCIEMTEDETVSCDASFVIHTICSKNLYRITMENSFLVMELSTKVSGGSFPILVMLNRRSAFDTAMVPFHRTSPSFCNFSV